MDQCEGGLSSGWRRDGRPDAFDSARVDDPGKPGRSPVLFLPRGTYRITKTLILTSRINVNIVGGSPRHVSRLGQRGWRDDDTSGCRVRRPRRFQGRGFRGDQHPAIAVSAKQQSRRRARELQGARSGTRCSKTAARARRTRPERERIMSIMPSSHPRASPS